MRLDPRRRFRDRLLIGMVAVALLPLAAFAVLAAIELDAVSRGTAEQAQGAILQDEQGRQSSTVSDSAGLINKKLEQIDIEVLQLAALVQKALAGSVSAATPSGLVAEGGTTYAGGPGDASSELLSPSPSAGDNRLMNGTAGLVPTMQTLRREIPEIQTVWVAGAGDSALRVVPGFGVVGALEAGRLAPTGSQSYRTDIFSAARTSFRAHAPAWTNPDGPVHTDGPYWTEPYPLLTTGATGVSAWVALPGGGAVGVDASITGIVTSALNAGSVSQLPPGAYGLLISTGGTIVWAGPGADLDFNLPADPTGSSLPLPPDAAFKAGLGSVEQRAHPAMLVTQLGGAPKDVFTSPVYAGHWVLVRPVPVSALEPDLTGLTHGITAGVHRLFPLLVLPALLLLLILAFVAATLLSRRLVGPVRNLTVAAETLAAGHTEIPVPPQGGDEVGVLAATLERMRVETNSQRDEILAGRSELEGRVARRTLELRARNDELVALNALAASLTRSLDPQLILQDALDAVRAIHPLSAARGYVMDMEQLTSSATWGGGGIPTEALDAIAAEAVHSRRTVRRRSAAGTLLGWPLATRQGSVGALAVLTENAPSLGTRRLLQAVADQVALALRTSRLSAAGRDHAVLEERTRLAREIHDTLAQQLTGIVIQLEAADTMIERGSDRARQSVEIARDLARSALQEARRSVWNLRPAPLRATGLLAAIQREAETWAGRTGITARVRARTVPARPALLPAAEVALLRIVQEALSNIARHAHAGHVDITLHQEQGELVLSVRDDGEGFDPAAPRPREDCFGLDGMLERVRGAGGTIAIVSAPGAGTDISARLPLSDAAAEATPA